MIETKKTSHYDPLELFTPHELAERFKLSLSWLAKNRHKDDKIPFRKFGRSIRYQRSDLTEWLREDKLILMTPAQTANLLKYSTEWLQRNRLGNDPIPFKKIDGLIRYHRSDVEQWLEKKSEKVH